MRNIFREEARDVLRPALEYLDLLRGGQVPFDQLVIKQHLSRDPAEYTKNSPNAIVASEQAG
jgi:DNA polymerase elongation subunit (family B)